MLVYVEPVGKCPDETVVISAPLERVYLFDTDTGERLR